VLPALRRTHPDLKLYLREDLTARLIERLTAGPSTSR
jgi:LysR family hydrogen peroxide-inducible transcriptional activator